MMGNWLLSINNDTRKIVAEEDLVETFIIRPYSEKMWAMKLEELNPQIIK